MTGTAAAAAFIDPDAGLPPGGLVLRPDLIAVVQTFGHTLAFLLVVAVFAAPVATAMETNPRELVLGVLLAEVPFLLLGALGLAAPIVTLVTTRYVLSEDALIVRTQFLTRTEKRIEWAKVTEVTHRWTLFDRLLGIERLDVVAYGEASGAAVHLIGLRKAGPYRDLIARRMREAASVANLFASD